APAHGAAASASNPTRLSSRLDFPPPLVGEGRVRGQEGQSYLMTGARAFVPTDTWPATPPLPLPTRGREYIPGSLRERPPTGSKQRGRWVTILDRYFDGGVSCASILLLKTSPAFEITRKRRKSFPSETNVKRGRRFVRGDVELIEKLGRN